MVLSQSRAVERKNPGPETTDALTPTLPRGVALALLWTGLPLLLAQAFIPLDEFVRRGDDAYYYFQVAANYPRAGFWTFDGTQSTNGVQPLWAMLLSAVAQLAAWIGVTDRDVLARVFVGFAAIVQFAAALLLFHLLAARTTVGTAFVATGATIFPLGFVWGRLWGVESPLLALSIVAVAAYYELGFRARPTVARAALVGLLLGVTCLSRLNAGLLAPCLGLWMLLDRSAGTTLGARWLHAMVAAAATAFVVLPYLAWNLATTDALLPISGQVKMVGVNRALEEFGAQGSYAWQVASLVLAHWKGAVLWFVSSRALDGLWVTGLRVLHDGAASVTTFTAALALLLGAPALLGRGWWATLRARTGQLAPFGYIAAFAVVDALVSVAVFPTQRYAITRWWLVSAETALAVITATILVAAMAHAGRLMLPRQRAACAIAAATLAVAAHAASTANYYWNGRVDARDWNLSWNDESLRAARWINANVPPGERVGAWNAGVLGYYAERPVVNLDGLINNAGFLPYLRERRTDEYVLKRQLGYLSDMDEMFVRELHGRLALTEVYRHHSPMMGMEYRIFRVDGPASAPNEQRAEGRK